MTKVLLFWKDVFYLYLSFSFVGLNKAAADQKTGKIRDNSELFGKKYKEAGKYFKQYFIEVCLLKFDLKVFCIFIM